MTRITLSLIMVCSLLIVPTQVEAQDVQKLIQSGKLILEDNFDRNSVGKAWKNNDSRALRTSKVSKEKFKSQLQLVNNQLHVIRTDGSDHAATARTDVKFKDAVIQLKFKLGAKDKFSVNTNDPAIKETVHAGHVCKVEIAPKHVLIQDQKLGVMDLKNREIRTEGTAEEKKALNAELAKFQKKIKTDVPTGKWHDLTIVIKGNTIKVHINNQPVGAFTSPGLGHATKENIALSVPKSLQVDDLKLHSLSN